MSNLNLQMSNDFLVIYNDIDICTLRILLRKGRTFGNSRVTSSICKLKVTTIWDHRPILPAVIQSDSYCKRLVYKH
ncbi:hypothetical protein ACF0H5_024526 [Mactra antiquata]